MINFLMLKPYYEGLWNSCKISDDQLGSAICVVAHIRVNRARYEVVQARSGVPWYVVAVIHAMEANCDFSCHLLNGDSLAGKTYHVPAGLPPGEPPFSWEYAAGFALAHDELTNWDWKTTGIAGILYELEAYNGWGYRFKGINSPYLWAATNQQQPGKYVADGAWDPEAVSEQIGAAALLKLLLVDVALDSLSGGKATLTAKNSTWLKRSPAQSSQLLPDEKVPLHRGDTLPLLAYLQADDHYKVTLDHKSFNNFNTWFVFADDAEIKPA